MKKSKFYKNIVFLAVSGAVVSLPAHASLYVSPVTKDSASVNYVGNVVSGVQSGHQMSPDQLMTHYHQLMAQMTQQGLMPQSGFAPQQGLAHQQGFAPQQSNGNNYNPDFSSTGNLFAQAMRHDNGNVGFGISAHNQRPTVLMNQGKDIPLFVAIEGIIPDVGTWTIHYDQGMHNLDMTWSGGDTWEGVIQTLAMQNGIFAEINHAERVIGLGKSTNIAKHLAKKVPTVWRVNTNKSLRENLTEWAEKAGWRLAWDHGLMIDYPVEHDAVFTGDLVGEDGAIDRILSSYRNADVPLRARFFQGNNVILVLRGGFEQQLSY